MMEKKKYVLWDTLSTMRHTQYYVLQDTYKQNFMYFFMALKVIFTCFIN